MGTKECHGGEGVGEVTVHQSAMCKLTPHVNWILNGGREECFHCLVHHSRSDMLNLPTVLLHQMASSLSFFLYPFGIKSNQIVLFRMGEKAYIDRLGSNAQLGVPSGSLLSQLVHGVGLGWAGLGWAHHHIVSKSTKLQTRKPSHHV